MRPELLKPDFSGALTIGDSTPTTLGHAPNL